METLTSRYEELLLTKTHLVDVSVLLARLDSKNLGTAAIEECLRKLHENQNISENTTKPYRKELLADKIKDVAKKLKANSDAIALLLRSIDEITSYTPKE